MIMPTRKLSVTATSTARVSQPFWKQGSDSSRLLVAELLALLLVLPVVVELPESSHTELADESLVTALPTISATTGNVPTYIQSSETPVGM